MESWPSASVQHIVLHPEERGISPRIDVGNLQDILGSGESKVPAVYALQAGKRTTSHPEQCTPPNDSLYRLTFRAAWQMGTVGSTLALLVGAM